jgi:hypothetical protein
MEGRRILFVKLDRVLARQLKARQDCEPFLFSQVPAGSNLRLTAVLESLAPGISYSENAHPEPESEEPHIVIHKNAKIFSAGRSSGQPARPAHKDQK